MIVDQLHGVIIYISLCGNALFSGDIDNELSYKILKSDVPFEDEDWEHVSENTKELVAGLLEKDHQTRATLDDIFKLVRKIQVHVHWLKGKKIVCLHLSIVIIITIIIMK